MQPARQINCEPMSIRVLTASLVFALCVPGIVPPARAQTNTMLGSGALGKVTTGTDNTALGFDSLFENTTASDNTAVGANALGANVGTENTATGSNALTSKQFGLRQHRQRL